MSHFPSVIILNSRVTILTFENTLDVVRSFIESPDGKCHHVVAAGFHGLWEAYKDPYLHRILNSADLWVPDGIAPVWIARLRGMKTACRIPGADLMHRILSLANDRGYRSFFYGDTAETLARLTRNLQHRYPGHKITGVLSPPFRPLTVEEDQETIRRINGAHPDIVWVGLGMPKQDKWIFQHRDQLNARVAIGVGAAFGFLAGTVRRAPQVVGDHGFEWAWRLAMEPRKLWKRYLLGGPQFVFHVLLEMIGAKEHGPHMQANAHRHKAESMRR